MKFISKETKTFKLFDALYNGEKVTQSDATKRFGIKNIAAEASRIRHNGYAVYAKSRVAGNGVKVTEYEMGKSCTGYRITRRRNSVWRYGVCSFAFARKI